MQYWARLSILFNIISISLLLLVSIDSTASVDLLKSMCHKSQNPAECETTLRQDPRTKTASTPFELANICIDLAMANATKCVDSVIRLQNLNTTPPALKPTLETCAQHFKYSVMEFQYGKDGLKDHSDGASYEVLIAGDGATRCDDAMKKDNVSLPEVTAYGQGIKFFAFLACDFVSYYMTNPYML